MPVVIDLSSPTIWVIWIICQFLLLWEHVLNSSFQMGHNWERSAFGVNVSSKLYRHPEKMYKYQFVQALNLAFDYGTFSNTPFHISRNLIFLWNLSLYPVDWPCYGLWFLPCHCHSNLRTDSWRAPLQLTMTLTEGSANIRIFIYEWHIPQHLFYSCVCAIWPWHVPPYWHNVFWDNWIAHSSINNQSKFMTLARVTILT
jgi:hypothetical protein